MPPNTFRVHMECVLVKSVGLNVLWAVAVETTGARGWRIFSSPPVPCLNCGIGDRWCHHLSYRSPTCVLGSGNFHSFPSGRTQQQLDSYAQKMLCNNDTKLLILQDYGVTRCSTANERYGCHGKRVSDGLIVASSFSDGLTVASCGSDDLIVASCGSNSLIVASCGSDGLIVASCGSDGLIVASCGSDGFLIAFAVGR
ncbi:hypothetical protein TNCV_3479761 [Trichonephila clavipes]|nr:hypothetical protein TNCV_3479761 [Trichonephila clavipes]